MENIDLDLLGQLEGAHAYLSEDIQALGYLQDEYFLYAEFKGT